jgi:hypothetical protein
MTSIALPQSSCNQVRVAVRVRPLTKNERHCKPVLDVYPPTSIGVSARHFTYDLVLDSNVLQAELYEIVSPNLLSSFLDGYNATIMAYGQTGSGKTYTIGSEVHRSENEVGLIPRFMTSIFETLESKKRSFSDEESSNVVDYSVKASFLEVYGEDVYDLLDHDRKTLPLRDDTNGGVHVVGLTARSISTAEEALQVLNQGSLNRTTAATLMNLTSSRSHAVFTIHLTQSLRKDSIDLTVTSKFTLVDLAGSERMKKTGAVGERALEGIKINEGLLALGNVINALADEERISKEKKVHVPYRQSKLTRLLQDSLGGNSQTLFIACVSPAENNVSETLSTLHYANRARNIKNIPTKNVGSSSLEVQRLQALNNIYLRELIKCKFGTSDLECNEVQDFIRDLHEAMLPQSYSNFHQPIVRVEDSSPKCGMEKGSLSPVSSCDTSSAVSLNTFHSEGDTAILGHMLVLQHDEHDWSTSVKNVGNKVDQKLLEERESVISQLRESVQIFQQMKDKYHQLKVEVKNLEIERASYTELEKKCKNLHSEINQLEFQKTIIREQIKKNHATLEEQKTLMLRQQESLKARNKAKIKHQLKKDSEEAETDAGSSCGSMGISARHFLVPILPTLFAIALGILALNSGIKDTHFFKDWIK